MPLNPSSNLALIANGQPRAADPIAGELSYIEKNVVNIAGDTMTGDLTVPGLNIVNSGGSFTIGLSNLLQVVSDISTTVNQIVVNSSAVGTPFLGIMLLIKVANTNTGPVTILLNGTASQNVNGQGSPLPPNAIIAGSYISIVWDGTDWDMINYNNNVFLQSNTFAGNNTFSGTAAFGGLVTANAGITVSGGASTFASVGCTTVTASGLITANGGMVISSSGPFTGIPYDIAGGISGPIGVSQYVLFFIAPRSINIPANFAGSIAKVLTAFTNAAVYTIYHNGTSIGSLTFAAGGTVGTSSAILPLTLSVGDILTVEAPATADPTAANLSITILANLA